eukprot:169217-Rhodomonas_salina.1
MHYDPMPYPVLQYELRKDRICMAEREAEDQLTYARTLCHVRSPRVLANLHDGEGGRGPFVGCGCIHLVAAYPRSVPDTA